MTTKKKPPKESVPPITGSGLEVAKRRKSKKVILVVVLVGLLMAGLGLFVVARNEQNKQEAIKKVTVADNGKAQLDQIVLNASIPDNATKQDRSIHEQNVAEIYLERGDKKAAFTHFKKALEFTPSDSMVALKTADVSNQLRSPETDALYKKAFDLYKQEIDTNPGDFPPSSYYTAAQMASKAKDVAAAKIYYQKTIESSVAYGQDDEAKGYAELAQKELDKL